MSYLICKGNYNSHILLPVSFVYVDLRKEPAQVAVILGFLLFSEGMWLYICRILCSRCQDNLLLYHGSRMA